MKLIIPDEIQDLMDKRGITKEDVETVITKAEADKTFLIADDGSFLFKYRLENLCPYVACSKDGDTYTIKTVYAHKVLLGHEFN